jgi:hypothetical protein
MPSLRVQAYYYRIASDHARYGGGSKRGAHDKRANLVAGSIWPGGFGGRQLGGSDHVLHLLQPGRHPRP